MLVSALLVLLDAANAWGFIPGRPAAQEAH
jgi:hypothetical protein